MGKQGRASRRGSSKGQTLPKVASGVAGLDDILEGGFPEGRITLISGGPGTGKSTLACTFVKAACARGEEVLYLSFEGSGEAPTSAMRSRGIEIAAMSDTAAAGRMHDQPSVAAFDAVADAALGGSRR
jgi:circadian clock protein KaiC